MRSNQRLQPRDTGLDRSKVIFFAGDGQEGKSTLLSLIANYAAVYSIGIVNSQNPEPKDRFPYFNEFGELNPDVLRVHFAEHDAATDFRTMHGKFYESWKDKDGEREWGVAKLPNNVQVPVSPEEVQFKPAADRTTINLVSCPAATSPHEQIYNKVADLLVLFPNIRGGKISKVLNQTLSSCFRAYAQAVLDKSSYDFPAEQQAIVALSKWSYCNDFPEQVLIKLFVLAELQKRTGSKFSDFLDQNSWSKDLSIDDFMIKKSKELATQSVECIRAVDTGALQSSIELEDKIKQAQELQQQGTDEFLSRILAQVKHMPYDISKKIEALVDLGFSTERIEQAFLGPDSQGYKINTKHILARRILSMSYNASYQDLPQRILFLIEECFNGNAMRAFTLVRNYCKPFEALLASSASEQGQPSQNKAIAYVADVVRSIKTALLVAASYLLSPKRKFMHRHEQIKTDMLALGLGFTSYELDSALANRFLPDERKYDQTKAEISSTITQLSSMNVANYSLISFYEKTSQALINCILSMRARYDPNILFLANKLNAADAENSDGTAQTIICSFERELPAKVMSYGWMPIAVDLSDNSVLRKYLQLYKDTDIGKKLSPEQNDSHATSDTAQSKNYKIYVHVFPHDAVIAKLSASHVPMQYWPIASVRLSDIEAQLDEKRREKTKKENLLKSELAKRKSRLEQLKNPAFFFKVRNLFSQRGYEDPSAAASEAISEGEKKLKGEITSIGEELGGLLNIKLNFGLEVERVISTEYQDKYKELQFFNTNFLSLPFAQDLSSFVTDIFRHLYYLDCPCRNETSASESRHLPQFSLSEYFRKHVIVPVSQSSRNQTRIAPLAQLRPLQHGTIIKKQHDEFGSARAQGL